MRIPYSRAKVRSRNLSLSCGHFDKVLQRRVYGFKGLGVQGFKGLGVRGLGFGGLGVWGFGGLEV